MSFRIGAMVLIDRNAKAIQSYNFKTNRVLGSLEKVLKFLDAYGIDEIHAIIPYKGKSKYNSSNIFLKLSDIAISTPLSIGGGITEKNIKEITKDPFFERCIFNSAIFNKSQVLEKTKIIMGHQSMVASIPFKIKKNTVLVYNSESNKFISVNALFYKKINRYFNEIILLDAEAEGNKHGFNFDVLKYIEFPIDRILVSGGLTKKDINNAKNIGLAGVSIDNFVLHSEYSIGELR